MKARKNWVEHKVVDGVGTVTFSSWKAFQVYISGEFLDYRRYIFRGQRRDDWLLEPTLDRMLKKLGRERSRSARKAHLEHFKFATRGRRGNNPPPLKTENDWWSLGQHHGLATPLLDWTSSPFVAAYFAFMSDSPDRTDHCLVCGLHTYSTEATSREIKRQYQGAGRPPIVEILRPMTDENPRLVNQGALFTRGPDNVDLESWIRRHNPGDDETYGIIRFAIPDRDREICLKALNRMNINHLTLFPDLYGASRYCNTDLTIKYYS
jgi:hypothetical protein